MRGEGSVSREVQKSLAFSVAIPVAHHGALLHASGRGLEARCAHRQRPQDAAVCRRDRPALSFPGGARHSGAGWVRLGWGGGAGGDGSGDMRPAGWRGRPDKAPPAPARATRIILPLRKIPCSALWGNATLAHFHHRHDSSELGHFGPEEYGLSFRELFCLFLFLSPFSRIFLVLEIECSRNSQDIGGSRKAACSEDMGVLSSPARLIRSRNCPLISERHQWTGRGAVYSGVMREILLTWCF